MGPASSWDEVNAPLVGAGRGVSVSRVGSSWQGAPFTLDPLLLAMTAGRSGALNCSGEVEYEPGSMVLEHEECVYKIHQPL